MKPRLLILVGQTIIYLWQDVAKAAVVTDISESGVFEQHLTLYNVAGMSWPVRYSEVATLAQEF